LSNASFDFVCLSVSISVVVVVAAAADDDVVDCVQFRTRRTVPFGWLIKLGRRGLLSVLFLLGGALSALLSEGMVLRVLLELPSKLLSLLFSELIFVLVLGLLLRSDARQ